MRAIAVCVALAACGDNRLVAFDATVVDAGATCSVTPGTNVNVRRVAYGCTAPGAPAPPACLDGVVTLVTYAPNDPRLFALELNGRIRILDQHVLAPEPFIDLSEEAGGPVTSEGIDERGLLGLAFHPQYATNREFFVFYTAKNPDTMDDEHPYLDVLARYTARADDPSRADPASGVVVLSILDPFSNHNGGMIEFGPDGYLYIGTGDGGGNQIGMHGQANAQDTRSLLGKMLRIDVDNRTTGQYGIPAGNPFADGVAGEPEILMLGLRNPWRWSFDRETGDLWIGDVGQGEIEELTVLRAGEQAGKDLGWSNFEGTTCYREPCEAGTVAPQDEHTHGDGWLSIIGGQVYRGTCYPDIVGTYFYTDYAKKKLVKATLAANGSLDIVDLPVTIPGPPASLHEDARGELYVTDTSGNIYHLEAGP